MLLTTGLPLALQALLALAPVHEPALSPVPEPAGLAPRDDPQADSLAAPGRWTMDGGNPAGSGEAVGWALRELPQLRWEVDLGGELVGEPLVQGRHLLVEVDEGRGRRSLRVLDTATGRELGKPAFFKSSRRLAPSMVGGQVAFRSSDKTIDLRPLGVEGLGKGKRLPEKRVEAVGPPTLAGDCLYFVEDRGLVALNRATAREEWVLEGPYGGRAQVRGDRIYVLAEGPAKTVEVAEVDRETGRRLRFKNLGQVKGGDLEATQVVVFQDWVGVFPEQGLIPYAGKELGGFVMHRPLRDGTWDFFLKYYGFGMPVENVRGVPAAWRDGWVGWATAREIQWEVEERKDSRGRTETRSMLKDAKKVDALVAWHEDMDLFPVLADPTVHPRFAQVTVPPTLVGDVVYLGRSAVDLATGRILWTLDREPQRRWVPADRLLVTSFEAGKLTAMGPPGASGVDRAPWTTEELAAEPVEGALVTRDGAVHEASLAPLDDGWAMGSGKRAKTIDAVDVLVIEAEGGQILHASGAAGAREGVGCLVDQALGSAYVELAEAALASQDPGLLARLADRAVTLGARESQLKKVRKAILSLGKRPKPVKEEAAQEVLTREQELLDQTSGWLLERADNLPEDAPLEIQLALLDAALEADEDNEGAAAAVRALLHPRLREASEEARSMAEWIPFLQVGIHARIDVFQGEDPRIPDPIQLLLDEEQDAGRRDVVALRSRNLVVLAPPDRPGAIARCLAVGELVCEALTELTGADAASMKEREPLVVRLFADRQDYLALGTGEPKPGLSWTAGFYSPASKRSHLYLAESGTEMEEVLRTFAHEITHHWLDVRCPLWDVEDREQDIERAGYWIVEGFACLLEDFAFDLDSWSWSAAPRPSSRLDTLALVPKKELLDWEGCLTVSQKAFHDYDKSGGVPVHSSTHLGRLQRMSETGFFYAQGAATAQYLYFADGGARRDELVRFLVAYYGGEGELAPQAAFGQSAAELGAAVRAFAVEVVGG